MRLVAIDVVLIGETLRGAAADILMPKAAFHFVEHTFTQRAVRQTQLADPERIEHAAQNSKPWYKHRFAIFR